MDRTRRLTEEALGEAGADWQSLDGVLLVGGSTRMPMVRSYVTEMAGKPPRAGVNVDEVVALGAAIQAAMEVGEPIGDATPRFTLAAGGSAGAEPRRPPAGHRRDVAQPGHGRGQPRRVGYVNDVVIRRNVPIPAENTRSYLHATHGGANTRLEVYLTQGESARPLDCTILGKYVFSGIHADRRRGDGRRGPVVRRQRRRPGAGRPARHGAPPGDDRRAGARRPLVAGPAARGRRSRASPSRIRVYLLIDVSSSMTGQPLVEAQTGGAGVPRPVRLHHDGGRPDLVLEPGDAPVRGDRQRPPAPGRDRPARGRRDTNLTDALEMARGQLVDRDRKRYIVILTDGYPRRPRERRGAGTAARGQGIEIVAIGTGEADRDYLRRLASTEHGVDLRPAGRAGADLRPHRPGDRRGGPRLAGACHDLGEAAIDATVRTSPRPAPSRPGPGELPPGLRPGPGRGDRGGLRAVSLRGARCTTDSVYVRDALAGVIIGGSIGFFLNAGARSATGPGSSWPGGAPGGARRARSAGRSGWCWARW